MPVVAAESFVLFQHIPTHPNDRRAPAMPSEALVISRVGVIVGMLSTNVIIPEFLKMFVDAYSLCFGMIWGI